MKMMFSLCCLFLLGISSISMVHGAEPSSADGSTTATFQFDKTKYGRINFYLVLRMNFLEKAVIDDCVTISISQTNETSISYNIGYRGNEDGLRRVSRSPGEWTPKGFNFNFNGTKAEVEVLETDYESYTLQALKVGSGEPFVTAFVKDPTDLTAIEQKFKQYAKITEIKKIYRITQDAKWCPKPEW